MFNVLIYVYFSINYINLVQKNNYKCPICKKKIDNLIIDPVLTNIIETNIGLEEVVITQDGKMFQSDRVVPMQIDSGAEPSSSERETGKKDDSLPVTTKINEELKKFGDYRSIPEVNDPSIGYFKMANQTGVPQGFVRVASRLIQLQYSSKIAADTYLKHVKALIARIVTVKNNWDDYYPEDEIRVVLQGPKKSQNKFNGALGKITGAFKDKRYPIAISVDDTEKKLKVKRNCLQLVKPSPNQPKRDHFLLTGNNMQARILVRIINQFYNTDLLKAHFKIDNGFQREIIDCCETTGVMLCSDGTDLTGVDETPIYRGIGGRITDVNSTHDLGTVVWAQSNIFCSDAGKIYDINQENKSWRWRDFGTMLQYDHFTDYLRQLKLSEKCIKKIKVAKLNYVTLMIMVKKNSDNLPIFKRDLDRLAPNLDDQNILLGLTRLENQFEQPVIVIEAEEQILEPSRHWKRKNDF
eukprot:UN24557